MSVYNLETQSTFNYYVKHRQNLQRLSDREYVNNYFLVGEKIDKKEQRFSQVMVEILCTENCELINYINDKLNGKHTKKLKPLKLVAGDEGDIIINNITQVIERDMIWNGGESNVSW